MIERRPKWDLLGFVPWRHSYILLDTFIHSFIYLLLFYWDHLRTVKFFVFVTILNFVGNFVNLPMFLVCIISNMSCYESIWEIWWLPLFFNVYAVCLPCNCCLQFWYIFALFEHHPLMPQWSGCLTSLRFRPASCLTFEIFVLLMSVFMLTAS